MGAGRTIACDRTDAAKAPVIQPRTALRRNAARACNSKLASTTSSMLDEAPTWEMVGLLRVMTGSFRIRSAERFASLSSKDSSRTIGPSYLAS